MFFFHLLSEISNRLPHKGPSGNYIQKFIDHLYNSDIIIIISEIPSPMIAFPRVGTIYNLIEGVSGKGG